MKPFGTILLIVGIILGIYSVTMDTTVQVHYSYYSYGLPERVHNIGLMNTQRNCLVISGILDIVGVILVTRKSTKVTGDSIESKETLTVDEAIRKDRNAAIAIALAILTIIGACVLLASIYG